MIYERLLKARMIERCEIASGEIAEHLRVARHDIQLANNVAGLDLDWAFSIAYNGILQSALALMYKEGFRPRGEAKHYNTFEFLSEALPDKYRRDIERVQKLRAKRNKAMYRSRGIVSEKEAKQIIAFANTFHGEIIALMPDDITKLVDEEPQE